MSLPHCPTPSATPLSARFFDSARIGFHVGIGTLPQMNNSSNRVARGMPHGPSTMAIDSLPGFTLWHADGQHHTLGRRPACTAVAVTAKDGMGANGQVVETACRHAEATR